MNPASPGKAMAFKERLARAKTIADVFTIVQDVVRQEMGREQAGLLVGLADLGTSPQGFVGAFTIIPSNIIIVNTRPLKRVRQTRPSLYIPYLFHVILHEYVHSVGSYDEEETRRLVYEMSGRVFGEGHIATKLARDLSAFMPDLTYPWHGFQPPEGMEIEFVAGIDRKNVDYIS